MAIVTGETNRPSRRARADGLRWTDAEGFFPSVAFPPWWAGLIDRRVRSGGA